MWLDVASPPDLRDRFQLLRDEQFQRAGNDFEFHRQTRKRLSVNLRIHRLIFNERFAAKSVRLHKVDAIGFAEIAKPKRWQITEITKTALRGEHGEFELIFVKIGFGCDFERAAIVFGAANDDERAVNSLILRYYTKHGEFILENLDGSLPPIGEDSHFCFQFKIHGVRDSSIGSGAGDT